MTSDLTETFVKLLALHDRDVHRYIYSLLHDRAAADDVAQETAAAMWRKFSSYRPDEPFLRWAFGFAYLEVLKYRKRDAKHRWLFDDQLLAKLADERGAEQPWLESQRVALDGCLEELEPEDRHLLDHRYASEQSISSLADSLGLPPKQLYNALDRIRRQLLQCVERKLATEGSE